MKAAILHFDKVNISIFNFEGVAIGFELGITLARQAVSHLSHSASPFL
jgi:hypothetical protein